MRSPVVIASTALLLVAQEGESGEGTRFLDAALETAAWLESVALKTESGRAWPTQVPARIDGPASAGLDLYAGVPGVVLFFLEAHRATHDATHYARGRDDFLEQARGGTDWLIAELERRGDSVPAGLYTGVAGLGFTFCEAWKATGAPAHRAAAERCVALLESRGEETEHGIRWNASTDVISGSAGIGLFLLYAARELDAKNALDLARRAGDHLIALAMPEHGGSKWAMTPDFERRMPNFSHGTAGVAHFLVALYERTGDERFLEAARAGARYLRAIATPVEGAPDAALIFHSEPGREDLFYLGWCHGPAGTVRFLRTLEHATADSSWRETSARLVRGLRTSGIPGETPGFWNNVGACCGGAGVAEFLLALHRLDGDEANRELAHRLLDDLLARARVDEDGRRWTHAEHRVRPELLTTQTGAMQGAAGIGLALLHAHAYETGGLPAIAFPDDPWRALAAARDD